MRDQSSPGFDMTYVPPKRAVFHPPFRERIVVNAYIVISVLISIVIAVADRFPGTVIYHYVVERDVYRMIPAGVIGTVLFVSAIATMLRETLRGITIHPDGIVLRELLPFGLPRVRSYAWAQIDKITISQKENHSGSVRFRLWDGSSALLPRVSQADKFSLMIQSIAFSRAIPIEFE